MNNTTCLMQCIQVGEDGLILKEIFINLKNKINDKHRLIFWTAFFYIVIMGIIIYCFMTDFSNVQEYVYSEF